MAAGSTPAAATNTHEPSRPQQKSPDRSGPSIPLPITDLSPVHPHHEGGKVAPELGAGVAPIHRAENILKRCRVSRTDEAMRAVRPAAGDRLSWGARACTLTQGSS
ncbi:hypothetical protein Scani_71690 [Streptomyces caniferus]|uniref:Uncharacterized protein n=1 Tax=Streptomyces caniferus TaxID=285557 RepID=A0A640SKQ6_9ACTN|nr:hypothetical protein Scani_71690 [Streptomyces caniferus]